MTNYDTIFLQIDNIFDRVNQFRVDPLLEHEIRDRNNRTVPDKLTDDELLRVFATLIAFSQNANSKLVKQLILTNAFEEVFENFSVDTVSKMHGDELIEKYWTQKKLSHIRFKSKIFQIIKFASKIKTYGSLAALLTQANIPKRISSTDDIEKFWKGFKILQTNLKERDIPFLQSTTTLLHYLLDTGYDCIKPDLVVMKVAAKIGIVERETGDANFRKTVKIVQHYSLSREIRPSIVDLYFLIDEKQKAAVEYVRPEFYIPLETEASR